MLLFVLPVIIDKNNTALALGVTVNEKGEMVYNFTANPENTQII
jgi:hypothetical protein